MITPNQLRDIQCRINVTDSSHYRRVSRGKLHILLSEDCIQYTKTGARVKRAPVDNFAAFEGYDFLIISSITP